MIVPVLFVITLIGSTCVMTNVSYGLVFLLVFMFYIQMSLLSTLFGYVFNKGAGRLVGVAYFLLLFLVSMLKFF